jgi:hypothetical protein
MSFHLKNKKKKKERTKKLNKKGIDNKLNKAEG